MAEQGKPRVSPKAAQGQLNKQHRGSTEAAQQQRRGSTRTAAQRQPRGSRTGAQQQERESRCESVVRLLLGCSYAVVELSFMLVVGVALFGGAGAAWAQESEEAAEAPLSVWQALLVTAGEQSLLGRLAGALLAIIVAALFWFLVALVKKRLMPQLLERAETTPGVTAARARAATTGLSLIVSVLRWFVILMALLYVLASFGVNLLPLLTGIGFLGAALAFGSQALVKDVVTGLFILLEGQYAVGEYVLLNGAFGRVAQVGLRVTALDTFDGKRHYLPNGTISTIAVYPEPQAGYSLQVPLSCAEEEERLREPLEQLAQEVKQVFPQQLICVEEPEPYRGGKFVYGLRQLVVVVPGQDWVVTEELLKRVNAMLQAQGITPPAGLQVQARAVGIEIPLAGE